MSNNLLLSSAARLAQVFRKGIISDADDLAERLGTSLSKGLSSSAAEFAARARRFGSNQLPERQQVRNFRSFGSLAVWALLQAVVKLTLLLNISSAMLALCRISEGV